MSHSDQPPQAQAGPLEAVVGQSYPPTLVSGSIGRPVTWCYQLDQVQGCEKQTNSVTFFVRPHEPCIDESGENDRDLFQTVHLMRAEVAHILRVLDEDMAEVKAAMPELAHEFE